MECPQHIPSYELGATVLDKCYCWLGDSQLGMELSSLSHSWYTTQG